MARPKKSRLPEDNTTTPEVLVPLKVEVDAVSPLDDGPREAVTVTMTPVAIITPVDDKANVSTALPTEFNDQTVQVEASVEESLIMPPADNNLPEGHIDMPPADNNLPQRIFPEADQREMDRYICVINNCEQASRIAESMTHQRDLQLWGVHQYNAGGSRNSFARSFYFRELANARAALDHASKLRNE